MPLTLILAFVLQAGQVIRLAPTPDNPETDGPVVRVGVRIVGEVAKPGTYHLSGYNIPDLIKAAGGFTDKARRDAIVLHRWGRPMIFDWDNNGKGLNIWSKGVILFPGDVIDVWSLDDPPPTIDAPAAKPVAFVQTAPAAPPLTYVLGTGDVLTVLIQSHPDLRADVTVPPSGIVTLPRLGDVQAAGLTLDQLRERVTVALEPYFLGVRVFVLLNASPHIRVTIPIVSMPKQKP